MYRYHVIDTEENRVEMFNDWCAAAKYAAILNKRGNKFRARIELGPCFTPRRRH